MADREVLETMRGMRFFQGISEEHLRSLAELAKVESIAAGVAVFCDGEQTNRFYVVVNGSVGLEIKSRDGAGKSIFTVAQGELLGWSPILDSGVMRAAARTLSDTTLISFDAAKARTLLDQTPKLAASLLRQVARALAGRLHAMRLHMLEVCHHNLPDVVELGSHEGAD